MKDHIYTLVRVDSEEVFYVGRTNNPTRREVEHRYAAAHGHEDKYAYIREQLKDIDWELRVVREIAEGEVVVDYEDFYVIKYLREGQPLQNMRAGDARQAAAREMAASECEFATVAAVAAWKREREQARERMAAPITTRHPKLAAFFAEHAQEVEQARAKSGQRAARKVKAERERAKWLAAERAAFEKDKKDL